VYQEVQNTQYSILDTQYPKMRIVFFASGKFAIPILRELLSCGHDIVCVVSQPDKKAGRRLKMRATPVKDYCLENNLALFQPSGLNGSSAFNYLKALDADLFIVVQYGIIMPERIISLPKIFSINIHASLLPKYRGAAPINWAIINGEKETGISIIKMDEFVDTGEIILKKSLPISENDDAQTLSVALSELAKKMIIEAIVLIQNKMFKLTPQEDVLASYAPKLSKKNGLIRWDRPKEDIYNLIRGLLPWPVAYTYFKGRVFKIYKAAHKGIKDNFNSQFDQLPGQIVFIDSGEICVRCFDGLIAIKELQCEGGRRMPVRDFIAGHDIKKGDMLG